MPGFLRLLVCIVLLLGACLARAEITYLGEAVIPGTAKDLSGLKDTSGEGTPANRLGGMGSAIAYTGRGNRYVMVSDRGPKDGASDFVCRFHYFDITVSRGKKGKWHVGTKLVSTKLLRTEKGERLVGALGAFDLKHPEKSLRFDAEGARVGTGGNVFISEEYGPSISEFSPEGKRLRLLPVPLRFKPEKPAKSPKDEWPPKNNRGRMPNAGPEGLAISPDGSKLFAIMQGPLIQDGAVEKGKHVGVNNRLLEIDIASGKTREYVYVMDGPAMSVNEILAVNDHQFLVLERDRKGGDKGKKKFVYLIDIKGATDISDVASLPSGKLPAKIKPVSKKLFLDILSPKFGLGGKKFPEKVEGLAFGPDLPDGRRLLLVTSDNDFKADEPSYIWAFAIGKADLPGYVPQKFGRAP
jgi:hypothetical protein